MIDLLHLLMPEAIVCGAPSNLSVHQRAAIPGAHFATASVGQEIRIWQGTEIRLAGDGCVKNYLNAFKQLFQPVLCQAAQSGFGTDASLKKSLISIEVAQTRHHMLVK